MSGRRKRLSVAGFGLSVALASRHAVDAAAYVCNCLALLEVTAMSDNAFLRRTWIDESVEVDADRDQVYELLRDIDSWPSFIPGLARIVRPGSGPVGVGSRFVMVLKMPRAPAIFLPCKVYELGPSRMEWGGGGFGSVIRHSIELEPLADERTRMRQVEYATGVLALLTLPFEKAANRFDRSWSEAVRERFARPA
jgi:hypothetical protein